MLFIVITILYLLRRLVTAPHTHTQFCSPYLSVLSVPNQSDCTLLHWLPLSFFCLSFVGPLNGLRIHSLLTSLCLSSFSHISLSLDRCPSTHWGRICTECVLSMLNGYIPVSVGSFESKLVQGGALLAIRGAWFPLFQTEGTL